ncbi:hypothetical protein [Aureitalea marina]|nr:hypothetical protein [Aureitalea marina]
MDHGVIFIQKGKYSDVIQALRQWIELYTDALEQGDTFTLYQADKQLTVIQLNQEMDNEHFNYLVNYLTYPEGLEDRFEVNGYTRIVDKSLFPGQQLGDIVQIYVPQDDTEFDIIHGIVQSRKTFKIDFGGKSEVVHSEKSFSAPNSSYCNFPSETIDVKKRNIEQKRSYSTLQKFNRRFNIITPIYLAGIGISGYFTYGSESFLNVVKVASFGMFFWVILEHDRLRLQRAYLKLLAMSITLAVMGYYASMDHSFNVWLRATRMGLCFLILYPILRFLYKAMYKREPELDKHSEHFADKVYSLIIMMGAVAASLLI